MSLRLKKTPEKPSANEAKLTKKETACAFRDLVNTKYRAVERSFVDPEQPNQSVALFSFLPCEGATPNKFGIFGFAKVRGVYSDSEKANERAKTLLRDIDSVNYINHVLVGQSFPVGNEEFQEKWVERVVEKNEEKLLEKMQGKPVDLAEMTKTSDLLIDEEGFMEQVVNEAFCDSFCVSKNREQERNKRARQAVSERTQKLLDDAKFGPDVTEQYITERNKYASVAVRYTERLKEIEQYKKILIRAYDKMKRLESDDVLKSFRAVYEKTLCDCGVDLDEPFGQKVRSNFESLPLFDFITENK